MAVIFHTWPAFVIWSPWGTGELLVWVLAVLLLHHDSGAEQVQRKQDGLQSSNISYQTLLQSLLAHFN
jgi:hypothetical protein